MSQRTHSIQLSTGVELPYVEQGNPAGVPTILLHGYTDSLRSFELLLPHLPDSLHVYALTQRGHGEASRPESGYELSDLTADVVSFMDAKGIEKAVLVGHSAGSYVTQRFALDHPERTLGTVLIGSFLSFRDNPDVVGLSQAIQELTNPVPVEFAREFQESCVAEPVPARFFDSIVQGSAQVPARIWRAYLEGLLEADVPTESGVITAPSLIMWGDKDAFCPHSDQLALLASIPYSRLSAYEGVGHCPHWERPDRTAAEIAAFAAEIVAREAVVA